MADVRADPGTGMGNGLRPGGGQYPDYELGESTGERRYGRYESGRDVNYYEADPNLAFALEGHLDARTMGWAGEKLDHLGERAGYEMDRPTPETPLSALTDGYAGVSGLYEPLVAEQGCSKEDYRDHLRALGRD